MDPVTLIVSALVAGAASAANDQDLVQDRVLEEASQRYLDRMQELILDKD